jgi:predicted nucleic acid-binding protein
VIVIDASVLASVLGDDGEDGMRARRRVSGERLYAPELIDLEVLSVWRRALRAGHTTARRTTQAVSDLQSLPMVRAPHRPLLSRIWELGSNVTPYDAAYVALAEALSVPLVTADRRIAQAPGVRCEVALVT